MAEVSLLPGVEHFVNTFHPIGDTIGPLFNNAFLFVDLREIVAICEGSPQGAIIIKGGAKIEVSWKTICEVKEAKLAYELQQQCF